MSLPQEGDALEEMFLTRNVVYNAIYYPEWLLIFSFFLLYFWIYKSILLIRCKISQKIRILPSIYNFIFDGSYIILLVVFERRFFPITSIKSFFFHLHVF
jgi:hypothetical protein